MAARAAAGRLVTTRKVIRVTRNIRLSYAGADRVPSPAQSGQRDVASASAASTANQKWHWLQRFFTMPGSGSHGSALIARASVSASCGSRHGFARPLLVQCAFLPSVGRSEPAAASVF